MDDGLVEVLVVVRDPRRLMWTTFGRFFNEEGQKSANVELLGQNYMAFSHFLFIHFNKIQVCALGLSTWERRSSLMCSLSLHLHHPPERYMMVFSSIVISTIPPGKSTWMTYQIDELALQVDTSPRPEIRVQRSTPEVKVPPLKA